MSSVALQDLSLEFGKITCIIVLGYACGKRNYITFKKRTLAQLLSKLILPVVFFYSTATMRLAHINMTIAFLGLLSRFLMMLIYYIPVQLLYHKQTTSSTQKLEYWAISTLFVTMSYDIPIGYPIASILWSDNHDAQYILTWAALSKIFIMSLCIAILNYCKSVNMELESKTGTKSVSLCRVLLRHCVSNPIIVGIFCGLILNVICSFVFHMKAIPFFLQEICLMIKNSYPFTALFIIGYGIAEAKISVFNIDNHQLGLVMLLVIGKCFVSPTVFYAVFKYAVQDPAVHHLIPMACFYGMLPVSASPNVLSIQYKVYNDIIEFATIICLVVSGPILVGFLFGHSMDMQANLHAAN